MIAFGCAIVDPEAYRRFARRGIALAAEPDSPLLAFAAVGAIGRSANLLLDAAARLDDLEALVLVDQDIEITDRELAAKVRAAVRDESVAVAGVAGATGVRSLAWWEGELSVGSLTVRYREHGGGEIPAYGWGRDLPVPSEVDVVDGSLLVLSAWAVRNLRFDERLALGHGYDVDYCLQARAAGRRVTTADIRAVRHRHSLDVVNAPELWVEAHMQLAAKWDGRIPGFGRGEEDPKRRARRAEAEREAARTIALSAALDADARALPLERTLEAALTSRSWRVTEPLRRLNRLRRG